MIELYTIGFTQTTAQDFFERLIQAGVKTVIDVRLNNRSQLSGFSKFPDLRYFLAEIGHIGYIHQLDLAPTKAILDAYKKPKGKRGKQGDWILYTQQFNALMAERHIESTLSPELLNGSCLLCSEATPHHCHRRLVAEYLAQHWGNVSIRHL
ncbi:MAG: DUF488 domain-containing protein [Merismopedia sp. SIO2A8]|nr:DUF488 domain-containing protein [Symploca sp. SIO2B6]NET50372.1 DUF488 domain-containing protein [Merismopedia sp. SIO2A8]